MNRPNWKKILLFSTAAALSTPLGHWMQCIQAGGDCPFNAGTILAPAVPVLVTTLTALFSNPWKKQ